MDYQRLLETTGQVLVLRGGKGSGNWGHAGRKGKRGGSGKDGGLGAIGGELRETTPGGSSKVSQGLNLLFLPGNGKVGIGSRAAIDVINSVHGVDNLPTIFLESDNARNQNGGYTFTSDGKPVNIKISTQGDHPRMTTAHEIGHFLDHQGSGEKGVFSSEAGKYNLGNEKEKALSEKTNALYDEISNSKAITTLKNDTPKEKVEVSDPIFKEKTITYTADKEYVNFLMEPHEQFARAYSQYIATKSGDTEMKAELDSMRTGKQKNRIYYHEQWEDDDFRPIAKAFDNLFLELGWIETK